MQNEAQTVDDMLVKADALFRAKRDGEALLLYRAACGELFVRFHSDIQGETLMKLLTCLRGLAISALVSGRDAEGRMALGTAVAYTQTGLKHWPSAPPLLAEEEMLLELENKIGGTTTVLIREENADNWAWPFSD